MKLITVNESETQKMILPNRDNDFFWSSSIYGYYVKANKHNVVCVKKGK